MGNYEIQAKIDIERNPEWGQFKKDCHLIQAKNKDREQYNKDHNIIWITTASPISWAHDTNDLWGFEPQVYTIDEGDYWDCRPIISPNVFRAEVLGDVRI